MAKDLILTGLFLLLMIFTQRHLPGSAVIDNLTFYLSLAAVLRFTLQTILWWIERIVITSPTSIPWSSAKLLLTTAFSVPSVASTTQVFSRA